MGTGYIIECNNCSFTKEVDVGVGMMHGTSDACILSTSKKDQAIIKEITSKDKKAVFDIGGYSVFKCSKCSSLSNKFHIKVNLDDKILFDNNPNCRNCKIKMDLLIVDEDQMKIIGIENCPKCKNDKITINQSMLWD